MKIYKTQEEVEKDIKDNLLIVNESVTFEFSLKIEASLKIRGDINARDINAWDINAWDINAWDINAGDINARDINAGDINAGDIVYWAFCVVYYYIKCKSIRGERKPCAIPIALDGKVEIKKEADGK